MAISLASISKTERASQPPRIVVYGSGGVGKSTFAANAFKPIFLPFEDGLSGIEAEAFPLLRTVADTEAALDALLNEKHEYQTVVLDSLDWLEAIVHAQVAADHGKKSVEDLGYGKGYVEALTYWRRILDRISALRARGMAAILIAHSEIKRYDDPQSEAYDRIVLKLHRLASALVIEWADVLGLAQLETQIKKENVGFQNRARGITTGRRILRTNETPAYLAKNRYSLPDPLPLDWESFIAAFQSQPNSAEAA